MSGVTPDERLVEYTSAAEVCAKEPYAENISTEETGAKKTNIYNLFLYGTRESHDMQQRTFIRQFYDGCQNEKSYLDGISLSGLEVERNARTGVARIIKWLDGKSLEENGEFKVNLTGFSRGAVTAIRIANYLEAYIKELEENGTLSKEDEVFLQKLNALKLNIFAADPVAGITAKGVPESCIIPAIADTAIFPLHSHEMRPDFKPQDMTRLIFASPKTKRALLPLYDVHPGSSRVEDGRESTGHIVWSMLYSFLITNGSSYEEMPAFVNHAGTTIVEQKEISPHIYVNAEQADDEAPEESKEIIEHSAYKISNAYLCNEFALHHLQEENCAKAGQAVTLLNGLPMPKVQRKLAQQLEYYVRDSWFFVNKLDRELFKITYPKTFNYLFEKGIYDPGFPQDSGKIMASLEAVHEELKRMKVESPNLHCYLINQNLIAHKTEEDKFVLVPQEPQGTPLLESLSAIELVYPDKVSALKFSGKAKQKNNALNEVAALSQNIYSATFQYQRKKAGHDIFKKKAEHLRAETIQKEALKIMKRGGEPEVVKQALLVLVYKHSMLLHLEGSKSRCLKRLDDILTQNGEKPFSPGQNSAMTSCIRAGFKVLDESIYFISTGAYVGGAVLSVTGLFLKNMGKRIEHLNTGPAQTGEQNAASSSVATTAISMVAKGLITIGNVFHAHFGLKVGREALRAELRDSRHGFFAKKIHSVNGNIDNLTLVGVEARLELLGKVSEHSPKKIIDRYNVLQERKKQLIPDYRFKRIFMSEMRETSPSNPLEFGCSM